MLHSLMFTFFAILSLALLLLKLTLSLGPILYFLMSMLNVVLILTYIVSFCMHAYLQGLHNAVLELAKFCLN